jgi:hypothetical protein
MVAPLTQWLFNGRQSMNRFGNHVHGHRGSGGRGRSGTYISWMSMKGRCGRVGTCYEHITYDERWAKFEVFLHDMGERPPDHELDRIDPTAGYTADNCRWLPREENRRRANTRRYA